MEIKKFVCINCGAPKVNEYKSPYIVCDYCGSFYDVDYTLGFNFWNAKPEYTQIYIQKKAEMIGKSAMLKMTNNREEYLKVQRDYWDTYYRCFPPYLPPSIDSEKKYNLYLDVAAEITTDNALGNKWRDKDDEMARLQVGLRYYKSITGETKVENTTFFKMAEFYIDYLKVSFNDLYANPEYELMHEVLPQAIHLKTKLSMFVQVWLPYLLEEDQKRLLKMTGFTNEYVELEMPPKSEEKCEHCGAAILVPEGSYKAHCDKCFKVTRIKMEFDCMSCGAKNKVPENPAKPINCEFCGTENRLIKALFG
jgi:DNA-directed RNA polymerase subunit RPC12/RpoP